MTQRTIRTIIDQQELVTAAASMTVSKAARLMQERRVGAIMVVEGEQLVGMFTERDALFRVVAKERDGQTTPLAEVMTRNPRTIHPDKPFAHALEMMHEGGFRRRGVKIFFDMAYSERVGFYSERRCHPWQRNERPRRRRPRRRNEPRRPPRDKVDMHGPTARRRRP